MGMSDSLRREFAQQVSKSCAFDGDFAEHLSVRDQSGRRVVVPVLDSDSVHLAVRLVQQAGGEGTLVVRRPEKDVVALAFLECAVRARDTSGDHHPPVGKHCTIADLLKVLVPGSAITMSAVDDDGEELRIADVSDDDAPGDPADEFALS